MLTALKIKLIVYVTEMECRVPIKMNSRLFVFPLHFLMLGYGWCMCNSIGYLFRGDVSVQGILFPSLTFMFSPRV
jgi:hypothetical protein